MGTGGEVVSTSDSHSAVPGSSVDHGKIICRARDLNMYNDTENAKSG